MKFNALPLKGAFRVELEFHGDRRGRFARTFCAEEFARAGLETQWLQMNTSLTAAVGTVRGIHFQRVPHKETKLIRCVRGAVWDVAVDLREGSETFGHWASLELTAENGQMMYLPEGFGHGFQCLVEGSELVYLHSANYAPDHEGGVSHSDPSLAIDWPLPVCGVSPRDSGLPLLHEIDPIV